MTDEAKVAMEGAAVWVEANLEKINAGLRALLCDEAGRTRTPFVLLMPDPENGSRIVHNLGGDLDVAHVLAGTARNLRLKVIAETGAPLILAVIEAACDGDDETPTDGKVH